jgi:hypothetical protein
MAVLEHQPQLVLQIRLVAQVAQEFLVVVVAVRKQLAQPQRQLVALADKV